MAERAAGNGAAPHCPKPRRLVADELVQLGRANRRRPSRPLGPGQVSRTIQVAGQRARPTLPVERARHNPVAAPVIDL
jgi:hypothetical protein